MTLVTVPRGPRAVELDICYGCNVVWFDEREADVLRELYAIDAPPNEVVDRHWKWAAALMGMPVRRRHQARLDKPWVTWGIAAVVTVVSLIAWYLPWLDLFQFSFVPARAERFGGITVITSFFLHGGYFHLLGNIYFFLMFGALVEDYLGRGRYVVLLAVEIGRAHV